MTRDISQPLLFSRRKRRLLSLVSSLLCFVFFLLIAEVILRQKGFRPWVVPKNYVRIEPPGSYHIPVPEIGYLSRPGVTTITLLDSYSFKMTHLADGSRITHPLNTYPGQPRKAIWIFGCSFTHGQSLNDEQTYPWVLQEQLPSYEIVNFGVDAFSTVQSLLQFQQALKQGEKPALVVLAYGSMHDPRNTLSRSWMKARMPSNTEYVPGSISLPYVRFADDSQRRRGYLPLDYRGLPFLRYSALANFLDDKYNEWLEESYRSHEISKTLIDEFADLCKENGVDFVVAGIYSTPATTEMLEYLDRKRIKTVDISVDLRNKENSNLPYDDHPNAVANQAYARKLKSFLCDSLTDQSNCVSP